MILLVPIYLFLPLILWALTYVIVIFGSVGGDKIEGQFLSPAQHQIHHSDNVKHFDRNFGTALSIWDRLFHCFMRASEVEKLTFGIGKEGAKHKTLFGIYIHPFFQAYKKLRMLFSRDA